VSTTAELEAAIANAQPGDTVVLAPGVYRPLERLTILVELTIQGDPSGPAIVEGDRSTDGEPHTIFEAAADNVRFENLTLRKGRFAIVNAEGGNVFVSGVTVTGNTRIGIAGGDGGGRVTVVNSTVADNVNPGTPAEVAFGIAGACASFTPRHVTVAGNDRGVHFGACSDDSYTVENTLVVENTSGDCSVDDIPVLDGNISFDSDGSCRTMAPEAGAIFTTVPNLAIAALADNGGPTMTRALPASSLAVDRGGSCPEARDQRGASRDALCDLGAFERSAAVIMNSTTGAGAVTFQTSAGVFTDLFPSRKRACPIKRGSPASFFRTASSHGSFFSPPPGQRRMWR
jgi:hypothetical protein